MNNILEHTQQNGRSLVAAVLLTAVAILAGSPSHAGDVKTITATGACVPSNNREARNFDGAVSTSGGPIISIECSLTRDLPQKPRLRRLDVQIGIPPAFPVGSMGGYPAQCLAVSVALDGSHQGFVHTQYIPEEVEGRHTLRFNNIRMVRHGTLLIACVLPEQGRVHSIRIDE